MLYSNTFFTVSTIHALYVLTCTSVSLINMQCNIRLFVPPSHPSHPSHPSSPSPLTCSWWLHLQIACREKKKKKEKKKKTNGCVVSHSSTPPYFLSPSSQSFTKSFLHSVALVACFTLCPSLATHFFFLLLICIFLRTSPSCLCLSPVNHSSLVSSCWVQTSRSLCYTDGRYKTHKTTATHTHAELQCWANIQ